MSADANPLRRTWLLVLFWAQVFLAAVAAVLAVATSIHADWIEELTGLDPDAGSGSAEGAVTLALAWPWPQSPSPSGPGSPAPRRSRPVGGLELCPPAAKPGRLRRTDGRQ